MQTRAKPTGGLVAGLLALLLATPALAEDPSFSLTLRGQSFEPATLEVPAGQKITLHITNTNATPAEFESETLRREKVIPPGQTVVVYVGPLRPGRYEFEDEFHPKARGVLIAR